MSAPPIVCHPAPILRAVAAEVGAVDDSLRQLAQNMIAAMVIANGVGLAAPQVGRSLRLIVARARPSEPERADSLILFNPRIVAADSTLAEREEGCLSIPGVTALVRRPQAATVAGLDEKGEECKIEADGLLAACLQHEIDHLNGVLFWDHLSALKRQRLIKKYSKLSARQ